VILLNGIAVANSIILVDFQKRLFDEGKSPIEAALEAGKKRLRPILITSLTTILAMLPVALGLGEGGRILQPLGIAVAGGLWVSMGFTLFVVPALQVAYLSRLKQSSAEPHSVKVVDEFDLDEADSLGWPSEHSPPEMLQ
jgi:HAE1 family hydrophobic/amphiphilic exporter-1